MGSRTASRRSGISHSSLQAATRVVVEGLESRRLLTTYTVTSNADTTADDGVTTLREAVAAANAHPNVVEDGIDTIAFAIPGTGVHTIALTSGLTLTDATYVDAYSQGTGADTARANTKAVGSNASLKIEITSANAAPLNAITVSTGAGSSVITGLSINGFQGDAIVINGVNAFITGNFIGLHPDGTDGAAFLLNGINVTNGANTGIGLPFISSRNVIAHAATAVRISGAGSTNVTVANNYIGLDPTGLVPSLVGDGIHVTDGASNVVIGSTRIGGGNVIGLVEGSGVSVSTNVHDSTIQNNFIGTDTTGKNPAGPNGIGIGGAGVQISSDSSNILVGGTLPSTANVIAFGITGGVITAGGTGAGLAVLGNSIHGNVGLGIDLKGDGKTANTTKGATNTPVLTYAFPTPSADTNTTVLGSLNATPNHKYVIQIFANDTSTDSEENTAAQGRTLAGSTTVTTDANGNASFNAAFDGEPRFSDIFTATATGLTGTVYETTSEFSAPVDYLPAPVPQTLSVSAGVPSIVEGDSGTKTVTFTAKLSAAFPLPLTVQYFHPALGEAIEGTDFQAFSGTLNFAAGETSKTFEVKIIGDTVVENDKILVARVTLDFNGQHRQGDAPVTIVDNDVAPNDGTVTLQGEDATAVTGGTAASTKNKGYTGTGYADFGGKTSSASWSVTRAAAGSAKFEIRYANGDTKARPFTLFVNGVGVGTYPAAATGSWATWAVATITASLKAGVNTIKIVAGSTDGANLDKLTITPAVTPPPPVTGTINGRLFYDVNKNGIMDGTGNTADVAQPGKVVFLDTDGDGTLDAGEKQTTTAADGTFSFSGLAVGTYKVRRVLPNGYVYTTPPRNIAITSGLVISGVLIGTGLA